MRETFLLPEDCRFSANENSLDGISKGPSGDRPGGLL